MSVAPKSGGCKTCRQSGEGDVCGTFTFQPNYDAEGNPTDEIGDIDLSNDNIDEFVNNMKDSKGNGFKGNDQSQEAKEDTKREVENELREALFEALEESGIEPKPNSQYSVCTTMKATTDIHTGQNCGHGADVSVSQSGAQLQ